MDKLPVVVRRWRDTNQLVAMFVTLPFDNDPHKCFAFSTTLGLHWVKPMVSTHQTIEVERDIAEKFMQAIPTHELRAISSALEGVQLEFRKRDRAIDSLTLRLQATRDRKEV